MGREVSKGKKNNRSVKKNVQVWKDGEKLRQEVNEMLKQYNEVKKKKKKKKSL